MKYIFTLLFSIMLIGSANSQTKQETLKWLNKNKKYITSAQAEGSGDEKAKVEMTESYIKIYGKDYGEKYETIIYWSKIEEISLYLNEDDKGFIILSTPSKGLIGGPFITLHLSKNITEMREKLSLMVRNYRDVMLKTFDMRGKSLFGN